MADSKKTETPQERRLQGDGSGPTAAELHQMFQTAPDSSALDAAVEELEANSPTAGALDISAGKPEALESAATIDLTDNAIGVRGWSAMVFEVDDNGTMRAASEDFRSGDLNGHKWEMDVSGDRGSGLVKLTNEDGQTFVMDVEDLNTFFETTGVELGQDAESVLRIASGSREMFAGMQAELQAPGDSTSSEIEERMQELLSDIEDDEIRPRRLQADEEAGYSRSDNFDHEAATLAGDGSLQAAMEELKADEADGYSRSDNFDHEAVTLAGDGSLEAAAEELGLVNVAYDVQGGEPGLPHLSAVDGTPHNVLNDHAFEHAANPPEEQIYIRHSTEPELVQEAEVQAPVVDMGMTSKGFSPDSA